MSYLNNMFDEIENINNTSNEIKSLSISFYETGNYVMGEKLELLSISLFSSATSIRKYVGKDVNDQLEKTQQATANMIGACLAMNSEQGE